MPDAPMPTGNRLNAIENALLKLMKAEPEEDDEASDHDLPERMKGEEHTYGYEEAVGFPVMPTDYIDVADDPEHWRHGSPNVARPKRVNIVDEGSHPAWEGAPEIMTTPKAGREGFPEVAGEPHSDTPGKWPTLTVPWKQAYERDEEPPTPKSYQPKGKPEYMGRGNVKNSIQNSLLKYEFRPNAPDTGAFAHPYKRYVAEHGKPPSKIHVRDHGSHPNTIPDDSDWEQPGIMTPEQMGETEPYVPPTRTTTSLASPPPIRSKSDSDILRSSSSSSGRSITFRRDCSMFFGFLLSVIVLSIFSPSVSCCLGTNGSSGGFGCPCLAAQFSNLSAHPCL